MRILIMVVLAGIMLTATMAYASGDLIVDGKLGVGSGGTNIQPWEKVTAVDSSEVGMGARVGNKIIYLHNDATTVKLDAYDYGTNLALPITIAGNGGKVGIGTKIPGNLLTVGSGGTNIQPWEKVTAADSSEAGMGARVGNTIIYLYNDATKVRLDAYDYYSGPGFLGHRNGVNFLSKETAYEKRCSQSRCSGRRA